MWKETSIFKIFNILLILLYILTKQWKSMRSSVKSRLIFYEGLMLAKLEQTTSSSKKPNVPADWIFCNTFKTSFDPMNVHERIVNTDRVSSYSFENILISITIRKTFYTSFVLDIYTTTIWSYNNYSCLRFIYSRGCINFG